MTEQESLILQSKIVDMLTLNNLGPKTTKVLRETLFKLQGGTDMENIICNCGSFEVFTDENGDLKCRRFDEDENNIYDLEEVCRLEPEEYEDLDIEEILDKCNDFYDISGELDDLSAYVFWRIVE